MRATTCNKKAPSANCRTTGRNAQASRPNLCATKTLAKTQSEFVRLFRTIFKRVFRGQKICALYFKICLRYFEICQTYFFFALMWVLHAENQFSIFRTKIRRFTAPVFHRLLSVSVCGTGGRKIHCLTPQCARTFCLSLHPYKNNKT